ncbi:MAG: hypothetical protein ONB44_00920 [candidate division KSB1 bacterium]|nr:hypothetical protein [candidate division KSB1 bacterium]MDZ7300681.1 hypothetical protein [candidate division KSB1 bacterium]MDZ7309817.1 hypothetical protein [candidate division KSB1 bacterium]
MKHIIHLLVAALVIAGLQLTACQKHTSTHHVEHPAEVKKIEGSDLSTVTLTERAMQRLDVKTDQVREQGGKKVVPYSSLIYDPKGQTWVYTSPEPRTFVRHKVDVDKIAGDLAILNDGPPPGTVVASVAVAEIYGAEFKVGH